MDVVFETMKETLERGEAIKLTSFGSFLPRDKKARAGRNPGTGEPVVVSARRVLVFRVSRILRDALNPRSLPPLVAHGKQPRPQPK